MYLLSRYFLLAVGFLCSVSVVHSQAVKPLSSQEIDRLVQRTIDSFQVPGIAVAVIKDGRVVHSKGYGIASTETGQRVDENTLFAIASNSKAFTATALGMLVDEGKLDWEDKVIDYIPEFRMYDPYVTNAFTIKDLLTHRSGLGLGAGDLMFWPGNTLFTREDVIHNLRYLKPVSGFRTKWDYDNLLYMVAGEVVARASGQSWENFVRSRILTPLQMTHTAPTWSYLKDSANAATPHVPVNGKLQTVEREKATILNAAGGIYSCISDLEKWVIMHLNEGRYDGNKVLISEKNHRELWTPQTILPVGKPVAPYRTHFAAYGLGFFLRDMAGKEEVMHTGGLAGFVTQILMYPELKLGIIVLTNQQSTGAFNAISNSIKNRYLGLDTSIDYVSLLAQREKAAFREADSITRAIGFSLNTVQKKKGESLNLASYTGTYHDAWFGDIVISLKNGKLRWDALRSPALTGELLHYKYNTFVVKWDDRSFDADAYVYFQMDENNIPASIKMKPISPLTDFSFDFQDLDPQRVK